MILKALTFEDLVHGGVSESFAKVLSYPEKVDQNLSMTIGKTHWNYFIPDNVVNIIPLWDENSDSVVKWEREGKIEYVCLFHDSKEWTFIAKSEQGVMAYLYKILSDFYDQTECIKIGEIIGFTYIVEAEERLENHYNEYET